MSPAYREATHLSTAATRWLPGRPAFVFLERPRRDAVDQSDFNNARRSASQPNHRGSTPDLMAPIGTEAIIKANGKPITAALNSDGPRRPSTAATSGSLVG